MMRTYILGMMLALAAFVAATPSASAEGFGSCGGDANALDDDGVTMTCNAGVTQCTVSGGQYGELGVPSHSCRNVFPVCICQVPEVSDLLP